VRRALIVVFLALLAPAPAAATISLVAQPATPRFGASVTLSGTKVHDNTPNDCTAAGGTITGTCPKP